MTKELLKVEFRYNVIPKTDYHSDCARKNITIGIYDNLDDAVKDGNEIIDRINKKFDGNNKIQDKLSSKGYIPTRIACNFSGKIGIFVTITKLSYEDLENTIDNVIKEQAKFDKWNK